MIRVRHTDEWVGALVIAAIALLLIAALQAGVLRDWFKPTEQLRLVLPATGVAGLQAGADVQILGTKAGRVQNVVLNPNQQMYAMLEIDEQAIPFIRRDSKAVIRRQFGLAGAAFVDISRGTGEQMDWNYAVIEATTERAPTDSVNVMIDEVRQKVFPILDNAGRTTQALAEIVERINRGEGNIGRLMVDQTLVQQIEATVNSANALVAELQKSAGDLSALTAKVSGPEGVPAVLDQTDAALSSLRKILNQVDAASQRMPAISKNVESSTANLPALLSQLQVTVQKLDQLVVQLRSSWLLGGGGAKPQESKQFSPSQVLP